MSYRRTLVVPSTEPRRPRSHGAPVPCLLLFVALALLALLPPGVSAQSSNGVLREVYLNIGGSSLADLTSNAAFPNSPSFETLEPIFEAPVDFAENYGQRVRAYVLPPATGNYVFWIASDDNSVLFLSTTDSPAQKVQIATVNGWTSSREWTKEPNQQSAPIPLVAGQRYYIEALQKEGGGGDNLAVGWQLPDATLERPIPQNRLVAFGLGPPSIAQNPTNTTVIEGGFARFEVRLARTLGSVFQWFRNGTNVPGATNAILSIGPVTLADSTSRFRCAVTNAYGQASSTEATLTVLPDTTRPTVTTVGNLGEDSILFIAFSEPVEPASATNTANYAIAGGISTLRATLGADGRTVILTTSPMPAGVTNTITISNVRDRATTPNTMLPAQRTFQIAIRPLESSYLAPPLEPLGPASRRHGVLISEVMYHPTNRPDARNLEFVELYNSQPWFEDISGWRLSGAIDYTFPSNTTLAARGFVVVAARPEDFRAVYTAFTNVHGPFANSNGLQNSSGALRLRNRAGAVVFEMNYSGDQPYPPQADGAGLSLALGRPSYGGLDPRAWVPSSSAGGSPGTADGFSPTTYRNLVINEILAHTREPDLDYVELHNHASSGLNVSGIILTDDPETNKFVIPSGTTIPARGFLVFTEAQLGFGLSAGGETLLLKHPSGRAIIDAVRFGEQELNVPLGRYPDAARSWTRLDTPTPGAANARFRQSSVVISELHFDPLSGEADEEFVELHNRSDVPIDLGGWRLRNGISFNLPDGTLLPAGGHLVVARNAARLRTLHPHLTTANCLGDFTGSLANGGERVELRQPVPQITTNALGQLRTNLLHATVDEVTYASGGRWGRWSGGGGSSLERIDARADGRLAPNWSDSDESAKNPWVTVEATGVMDHGWADCYQLHVTLLGAGETLIDNIEVIPANSTNLIGNGTFENGTAGWTFQGNHNGTTWETAEGDNSSRSLRIRTTGRGDSGANRIRFQLPYTLAPGTTVTLRARARWLKGNPNLLLRLRGNWLEAPGYLLASPRLGTPALPNSQSRSNAGPAITEVRHYPVLPAANEPVLVTARVHDPDGLAYLAVNFRVDPETNFTAIAMTNNGAGLFSTVLPPRPSGTTIAFHLVGTDNHPVPASATFPSDAPDRECVVRWGDNTIPGSLPTYRFWLTQTNVDRWSNEEKMSNRPKDATFLLGTNRVIYNAGAWFHGSPYHSPSYNSPVGGSCDYDLLFPDDDRLFGETDINLFRPGNGGGDGTGQAEIHGYWFGGEFNIPFLYHRPVFVFVNGQRRETIFHDAQQPNGDFVEQWFPDDSNGDLHKIMLGFEFGDFATGANEAGYAAVGANLARYTTTGGAFKQARYRMTWPRRSAAPQELNDYTNIFNLVNVVLTNAPIGSEAYTAALTAATDVEQWYKVHVTQHLYNNGDSFSYGGGQNAFAYKPERDSWKLFLWDVDFAFGGSPTDPNLTGIGGADHGPRNDHPPFARIYWQALIEAANGMLTAARSNPTLDARYSGMIGAGAAVGSPQGIKDFIAARRSFILSEIAARQSPFTITSPAGSEITTNRNLITLSGTAPLEVRQILINGAAYAVTWTSLSNWTVRVPLNAGTNALVVSGINPQGQPVAGVSGTIRAIYTGPNESPEQRVVINEIQYNPALPGAAFVEIANTSAANAFDLSGWRLDGLDFTFPVGTVIEPGAFLLAVEDEAGFLAAHGPSTNVAGTFPGRLDRGGETLSLLRPIPGGATGTLSLVDQVTYDDDAPWPAIADGFGPSLQLIDAGQDNNRVANWGAPVSAATNPPVPILSITNVWRYNTNDAFADLSWTTPAFVDSAWLSGPAVLYFEDAALPAPKNTLVARGRTTYYFRTRFTFNGSLAGAALQLSTLVDDGAIFYLNGQEILRLRMPAGPASYSTFASPGVGDAVFDPTVIVPAPMLVQGENTLAVEVHQQNATSSDMVFALAAEVVYSSVAPFTPGRPNSVRATVTPFPLVWLNEVQPENVPGSFGSLADRAGDRDPWVELHNSGTTIIDLSGLGLAPGFTNLSQWTFPPGSTLAPGQFRVVWLDGEPAEGDAAEWHASFRIPPTSGSIVLSRGTNTADILDYLAYQVPVAGYSFGSYPDGAVSRRRSFPFPTPNAPNNPAQPPIEVRFNEWLADNVSSLADPADGNFEDWIELYNPSTQAADLTGCHLTDSLANPTLWPFPDGTIIGPGQRLLIWADGEPGQNSPSRPDLHADFSLSKSGESIALFAPNGVLVDAITFGPQTPDTSEGRFPEGSTSSRFFTTPSPRQPNTVSSPNQPPTLAPIPDRTIDEGSALTLTLEGSDPDLPLQSLTYTLGPGSPTGATLNPQTGAFRWVPSEADGPGNLTLQFIVSDSGTPSLSATQSVAISIREVNNAPTLIPANSVNVPEGTPITLTNAASDPDPDAQSLTFSLAPGAPAGLSIDPATGKITWTPSEAQGPGTYTVTIQVTDSGTPNLTTTAPVTIAVTELNSPPDIAPIPDQSVDPGQPLLLDVLASDSDLPLQVLSYSLPALPAPAPDGAFIDPATGRFTWTPSPSLAGTTNRLTVQVADNGLPPRSSLVAFQVVVRPALQLSIQQDGNQLRLQITAEPGRTYQLLESSSLDAPNWSPAGANPTQTASGPTLQWTLPSLALPTTFYRVIRLN